MKKITKPFNTFFCRLTDRPTDKIFIRYMLIYMRVMCTQKNRPLVEIGAEKIAFSIKRNGQTYGYLYCSYRVSMLQNPLALL